MSKEKIEPPVLSNEEYERQRRAGIVRIGHPYDGKAADQPPPKKEKDDGNKTA